MVNRYSLFVKRYWLLVTSYWLLVVSVLPAYALNLDKARVNLLKGDYKQAILEGEKILANTGYSNQSDELYYILGLSYLKDGNYLRASDIFEIILKEFKDSRFSEDAKLGLGDSDLLRGDYLKAETQYRELLSSFSRTKLKPLVYYRLSICAAKLGNTQEAEEYLDKLKKNSPLNLECISDKDICSLSSIYYSVQIGSFGSAANAQNLKKELSDKNYPVYIEETISQGKTMYRVRVGKFNLRQEAVALQKRLSQEGYSTKIYP